MAYDAPRPISERGPASPIILLPITRLERALPLIGLRRIRNRGAGRFGPLVDGRRNEPVRTDHQSMGRGLSSVHAFGSHDLSAFLVAMTAEDRAVISEAGKRIGDVAASGRNLPRSRDADDRRFPIWQRGLPRDPRRRQAQGILV